MMDSVKIPEGIERFFVAVTLYELAARYAVWGNVKSRLMSVEEATTPFGKRGVILKFEKEAHMLETEDIAHILNASAIVYGYLEDNTRVICYVPSLDEVPKGRGSGKNGR